VKRRDLSRSDRALSLLIAPIALVLGYFSAILLDSVAVGMVVGAGLSMALVFFIGRRVLRRQQ
jgi:hypothetical protein